MTQILVVFYRAFKNKIFVVYNTNISTTELLFPKIIMTPCNFKDYISNVEIIKI